MAEKEELIPANDFITLPGVHQQGVVDAAREYVEAIEANVGKDVTKWLKNKQVKFLALKDALRKLDS